MDYLSQHLALVQYLKVKTEQGDWHGVSDAANDLRVLEAEHRAFEDAEMTTRIEEALRTEEFPAKSPRGERRAARDLWKGRCDCDQSAACPLGRKGSAERCSALELRRRLLDLQEAP